MVETIEVYKSNISNVNTKLSLDEQEDHDIWLQDDWIARTEYVISNEWNETSWINEITRNMINERDWQSITKIA